MILTSPRQLVDYLRHYASWLPVPSAVRALGTTPRRVVLREPPLRPHRIRREVPPELWWPPGKPFVVLWKPACHEPAAVLEQAMIARGLRCRELFPVRSIDRVLERVYGSGGHISALVIALYREDPALVGLAGVALVVDSPSPIDLLALKRDLRRRTGILFVDVKSGARRWLVGLNGVHIPDGDRMDLELAVLREHRMGS